MGNHTSIPYVKIHCRGEVYTGLFSWTGSLWQQAIPGGPEGLQPFAIEFTPLISLPHQVGSRTLTQTGVGVALVKAVSRGTLSHEARRGGRANQTDTAGDGRGNVALGR